MLKIKYVGCTSLSPTTSSQFTVEMCATAKNYKKINKTQFLEGSRSFKLMLTNLKSPSPVLKMCSMSVPICNRFHATQDNFNKITTFRGDKRLDDG